MGKQRPSFKTARGPGLEHVESWNKGSWSHSTRLLDWTKRSIKLWSKNPPWPHFCCIYMYMRIDMYKGVYILYIYISIYVYIWQWIATLVENNRGRRNIYNINQYSLIFSLEVLYLYLCWQFVPCRSNIFDGRSTNSSGWNHFTGAAPKLVNKRRHPWRLHQ